MPVMGDLVKRYREKLGLSQGAVARLMGYADRASIARIEANSTDMPVAKLEKLAAILQVSPAELLGAEPPQDSYDAANTPGNLSVAELPPEDVERAREYIALLRGKKR